jgi:ubiquinone/menaquinone biosynthesis C-methylase UbiE
MIALAQANLGGERIRWRQVDALDLPFATAEFDVVVCQFGAMFFLDKIKVCREALRVLCRGGRFLFNVWDRFEANLRSHCASRHE